MTVTWQHEAVSSTCGGRTPTGASSSWTGQWPQPLSHRVLPADCRTCPTLRNLFPTYPSSFSPISPFFSSSSFAFWDQTRLPAVRITRLPPSSSSIRQLQLFQWIDHNFFVTSYSPATRTIHSVGQRPRRPARQRHAVLPPSTMGASSVCTLNSPPRLPSLQPWFISGGMTPPSYF